MIRKLFSAFIIRSFTLTLILAMLLSGCSNSLFLPISEDAVVDPVEPAYSTGISLEADGLYSEYMGSTLTIYSNSATGEIPFTINTDSTEQDWTEYKIWEGSEPDDSYFGAIDFAGGSSASLTYSLSSSTEESYTVNLKLKNSSGKISDTETVIVKLDRTAPSYSLMINGSTGDTSTSSTSTQVQYYSKSANDFYKMKIWRNGDQSSSDVAYNTFSDSVNVSITATEGGEFSFGTLVMDKAGNVSSPEILTPTLTYTTTAPTFNFTIDTEDESATTTQDRLITVFTSNVNRPTEDPLFIAIWDSTESEPGTGYTSMYTNSYTHNLPASNGDYSVNARIRQGSNYSTVMSRDIRFDNTVPTISSFTINGSSTPENTNNGTLTMGLTAADNLAVNSELEAKIWRGAEGDEPADTSYVSLENITAPVLTSQGTYTYWAKVRDDSGNESLASSCEITYDITEPVITAFTCNDGSITRNENTALALTASADVTAYKLWVGAAEPSTIPANLTAWTSGSGSIPYTFVGDGTYNFHIRVYDEAGNESAKSDLSVIFDETDPTLSFSINSNAAKTNSNGVSLTITVPTDVTHYKIWEGSAPESSATWKSYPNAGTATADTAYTLTSYSNGTSSSVHMKVRDGAGNESGEVTDTIIFDNTISNPTISIDEGEVTAQNRVNLSLGADSDVTEMKLWLSTESIPSTYSAYPATDSFSDFELFPSGNPPADQTIYTIYLVVKDDAGNVSSPYAYDQITYDSDSPDISLSINGGDTASSSASLSVVVNASTGTGNVEGLKFWITSSGSPSLETEPADWDTVSGSSVTETYTRDLSANGEDTYTVHVKAINTAGIESTVTDTYIYDATDPETGGATIAINSSTGEVWTNNSSRSISLSFSGVTDAFGVSEMKLWYEGVSSSESTAIWENFSATYSDFTLYNSDGAYTVHALFRDEAGNESSEIASASVHLDRVAPTVSLTIGDGVTGTSYTDSSVVSFNTHYGESDLEIKQWIGSDSSSAVFNTYNPSTWDWLSYNFPAEGTYDFHVTLRDRAGNTASSLLTLSYDVTAPVINTFSILGTDPTASSTVNLSYHITETSSGPQVRFSNDNSSWSGWSDADDGANTYSGWSLTNPSTGGSATNETKTVYMQVKDNVGFGDDGSIGATDTVTFDNTAPLLTSFAIAADPNAQTAGHTGTQSLAISINAGETPASMKIWDNTKTESTATTYSNMSESSFAYTLPSANTIYTVYCRIYDALGNGSAIRSNTVTLDSSAPTLSGFTINDSTAPGDTNNEDLAIEISSYDNLGLYGMKMWTGSESDGDGVSYSAYAASTTYTLSSEGSYTVWLQVCDNAGNESVKISHSVTLDMTPPEFYYLKVADVFNGSSAITTTDGVVYVTPITDDQYEMKVWHQPQGDAISEPADGDADFGYRTFESNYEMTLPSSGSYVFYVLLRDEAGNEMLSIGSSATITY